MKVFKGCSLAFLSFILFFLLCIAGIAYTVNQVALNPHYINKIINDVNFSQLIQEQLDKPDSTGNINPELKTALIDTFSKMEPVIKQQVSTVIDEAYSYLKGQGTAPDLKDLLGKTVMNSDFVAKLLNAIDFSQLLDDMVKQQMGTGEDSNSAFTNALIAAVDQSEPVIKQQIVNASDTIFKYLLMQTDSIDLKTMLRQTILSDTTVNQMLDNFDYTTMTNNILKDYIGEQLPQDITLSSEQIDRVANALQPIVKTALTGASGTFADYLTGASSSFNVNISLAAAFPTLKTVVKEAYMAQLPSNLHGLPQSVIDSAFDQYYTDFSKTIPTSYEANSDEIGISGTTNITEALSDVQNGLADTRDNLDKASRDFGNYLTKDSLNAPSSNSGDVLQNIKTYIGYFRLGFMGLIALIVLLIAGIVLIYRNVKDACRNLGIVFTIYGALAFAVVLIAKFVGTQQLPNLDIPQSLHNLPGTLLNDVLSPLRFLSLACLIGGIILIVVSIVYPKPKPAKTEQATPPAAG
jgi:hypothetical protein